MLYYKYSDYLKNKYGEKVYKLPVNLPVTCPNRLDGDGCAFCAGAGTGFEAMATTVSVTEQLTRTRQMITRKYHANKYIAYFRIIPIPSSSGQISQLSDGGYQDSGCRGDICFHKTGLCFG